MWKDKLQEVVHEKKLYGDIVNDGATTEELQQLITDARVELKVDLPSEYIDILRVVNGIEFNGFILYGIDLIECNQT